MHLNGNFYLSPCWQIFYTVRFKEGEVNQSLKQRHCFLRMASLSQEVALLNKYSCKVKKIKF